MFFNKSILVFGFMLVLLLDLNAQQRPAQSDKQISVTSNAFELNIGQTFDLQPKLTRSGSDSSVSEVIETSSSEFIFFSRPRDAIAVSDSGIVEAFKAGTHAIYIIRPKLSDDEPRLMKQISVTVPPPPIESITFTNMPERIYQGTRIPLNFSIIDISGANRNDDDYQLSNSAPDVIEINDHNRLYAKRKGKFKVTLRLEDKSAKWSGKVVDNPTETLSLEVSDVRVRTGDVINLEAKALDKKGKMVPDAPFYFSFIAETDDQELGRGTAAQVDQEGRFVANKAGIYTIMVKSGNRVAEKTVEVTPRNVQSELVLVGQGKVSDKHTSDLWVWEGVDGRDYAVTGTWGADGMAYFWDVTNPANPVTIDTIQVDARTVNDVKIDEEGRIGVITREGASDRKNGIIILDVSDPANVNILAEYTEGLTGGVHNAFIYENHVYAVNNGTRYDIINIEDPANPYLVNRFELDTPGHSIHDVWIEDGIAYSSNWQDGIVAVDVGRNSGADLPESSQLSGGSPENPQYLGSYSYPSGWNHAAFPFKSQSTGDFYVVAGDEAFPNGLGIKTPTIPAGWIHFVKFDSWDNPKEVARYEIPEAGTHNYWIENDTLYIAYYNAGLRVVDISGELMGNLYNQGREIAHYKTFDPEGVVKNAPMAWGPQPYKGHIFMSDWNSGLWIFKLQENGKTASK